VSPSEPKLSGRNESFYLRTFVEISYLRSRKLVWVLGVGSILLRRKKRPARNRGSCGGLQRTFLAGSTSKLCIWGGHFLQQVN
jgi:hypothetical protein